MKPCLPVDDLDTERRARLLAEAKTRYRWNYEYLSPLPLADEVPEASKPPVECWIKLGDLLAHVAENGLEVLLSQEGGTDCGSRSSESSRSFEVGMGRVWKTKLLFSVSEPQDWSCRFWKQLG